MKLILYAHYLDLPPRCTVNYSICTSGNPFSDAKSAHLVIEDVTRPDLQRRGVTAYNVAIRIRGTNGLTDYAYIVDVP